MKKLFKSPLIALWLTVFIDLLGLGIVIPIFAALFFIPGAPFFGYTGSIFGTELSTSVVYGLMIAAYPFAQFIAAPILGDLSDKYGRRIVLILSITGTLISYWIIAFGILSGSMWLIFIGRLFDGLTGGNISVAQSAVADISTPETKAKNFGIIGMAFGLGFVIGPYLGGVLSDSSVVNWFSFATPFYFASVLTIVNILLIITNLPETAEKDKSRVVNVFGAVHNIQKAVNTESVRDILIVTFLFVLGFNFFTQFFQVYLIEEFGFTQSDIGNLFAYIGIWIALTQGLILPKVLSIAAPPKIVSYSLLILSITFFILLIPKSSIALWLLIPFIAVFNGLTHPNITTITSNLADQKSQGEMLGINQSVQSLAQVIPPLIAGIVNTLHPLLPTIVAGVILFLAWISFISFTKAKRIVWHGN